MEYPDLTGLLEEMNAQTEKVRTQAREVTALRLRWERQRTDDPELIKKLDRALAGEITWLDVLTSTEYERAHAAEFAEAKEDYERRKAEGTLPTPEEADAGLEDLFARMRSEVAEAERKAEQDQPDDGQPREWVYRPRISDS